MYPLDAYLFKLARWLQRLSRAFTAGASRDVLNLTASAPRLSDLLSNKSQPVTPLRRSAGRVRLHAVQRSLVSGRNSLRVPARRR